MKLRGRRECVDCGEHWSYFDTGEVECPVCGSVRSVALDEAAALHTGSDADIDLEAARAALDDRPLREVAGLGDLARHALPVARRQADSGSGLLLAHLLATAGLGEGDLAFVEETARSEMDLGLAILEGRARAGFAVAAVARALKLEFVPLMWERFDLLMSRRDYFEAPLQALFQFARGDSCARRAERLGGYDIAGLGTVHDNTP
jgi:hypothetical protein